MARESIVSSSCLAFLSFAIKEATFFSCIPLRWNAVEQKIKLYGRLRTIITRFTAGITSLLPLVITCRLFYWMVLEYDGSDRSTTMGFASVFGCASFLYNALISWHTQNNYKEHRSFINGALDFFAAIAREFGIPVRRNNNGKNGCEYYLRVYRVFIHFSVLSYCTGILIRKPDRPSTIMSFFEKPKEQAFFWPVTALNATLISFGGAIVQYFISVNVIYICAVDTSIARVRAAIEEGNMTKDTFRRFYRTAQVLQRAYNQLFGSWILPAQHNLVIAVVVIAVYGTVAMEGHRSTYLLICIFQLSNLSFLCFRTGKLHEVSMELLHSAEASGGRKRQGQWFEKFHKSCKPIVVTHGHMFYVDRTLILTVWVTIVSNAVNLLVMYG